MWGGGGGANLAKVDQTSEMYFYLILFNWRPLNFSFFFSFFFIYFFSFFLFIYLFFDFIYIFFNGD